MVPPRTAMATQGALAIGMLAVAALTACAARDPTPQAPPEVSARLDSESLFQDLTRRVPADPPPSPGVFHAPRNLRPCCAFGENLKLRVGPVPVPGAVNNVVDADQLGRHKYDGGLVSFENDVRRGFVATENNGMIYTCRGGFLDMAHVRDYADWTAYLAQALTPLVQTGGVLELPDEAGHRLIYVVAQDTAFFETATPREAAIELGAWLAFQLSIWHELATWYGWSALAGFPERVSAFSPEDLYSNLVGIKISRAVLLAQDTWSEASFNRAMDEAIHRALHRLGAVPEATARAQTRALDGIWWDSTLRLPADDLVRRRNLDTGPELNPWLAPVHADASLRAELRRHCGTDTPTPLRLAVPSRFGDADLNQWARLDLRPGPRIRNAFPFPDPSSRWLSQLDFPNVLTTVRKQVRAEFGPHADRP